ncbi:phosphoglucomutase [Thermosipho melanesiensis]|uniref:Phosphoglucomutase/phosphomannomutase alpha/beta/alpha domain I n=2 Tax=Thermosipho melanesiensis TaxID=46541 RepID=A6LL19_THEM4|nr:phospho-sugar mutase [Thermosipho melanesiensis]ABR30620.1 phosphoglucomutase/phosphomannomutase alpha/beta/alpha domain I [Thermosipho melanesiensis BI429]APT73760.1 phosphoglucomutase [Thermosipho melanesiensis]OOC35700.1 phosphoglucomutase [Thermosipho melanesiensis]OOC38999.1 phosphoglucomutase [Thermosipho melanesiensis]OOC39147.1 phosphoglucomutase [Thermosipho melanesiensis]
MSYMDEYKKWLESPYVDEETKKELLSIKDKEEEIKERFFKDLEFGTAGLRGKIGAGTNRMNKYVVAKATQGLADFINSKGKERAKMGVVIAYDVRHFSKDFAKEAASVLAGNGIKVYLFEDIRPTPELSFAVRHLGATAGIVITASHNPPEYNGYKVYWDEGSQILDEVAIPVQNNIKALTDFGMIKKMDFDEAIEKGLIEIIGKEVDEEYYKRVLSLALNEDLDKEVKIVYTPLNGTGNIPVRYVLKERGFKNVFVVKEQELPDPDFKTVGYPNPEDIKAFELALSLAREKNADIILATDPDCDRLAVMVKHNDQYIALNGNQTGAVLIQYILSQRKKKNLLSDKSIIIKSIVTGNLGKLVAQEYGVNTFETLTGFKNICGLENKLEKEGYQFEFGYEESIGFVTGNFVRDKDGVISAMMLAEAAGYYKKQGKTLVDVLNELYEKYGYYLENNFSLIYEGIEGMEKIKGIMEFYRKSFPKQIGTLKLSKYIDYLDGNVYNVNREVIDKLNQNHIPSSNVLRFFFEDGSWYAVRPSGTEPKLKVYIYSFAMTRKESEEKLDIIEEEFKNLIKDV